MKGNIFLKSGSCDWYRVNLFNIKKGKVHCIALKSCTILWKSIVQSMFQGQFCQQTFHKKLLFMNTWIQWEALLNECFIIFQLFQTQKNHYNSFYTFLLSYRALRKTSHSIGDGATKFHPLRKWAQNSRDLV